MRTFLILGLVGGSTFLFLNPSHALGSTGTTHDAQVEAAAVAQLGAPGLMLAAAKSGGTADLRGALSNHADADLNLLSITTPVAAGVQLLDGTSDLTTGAENVATLTSVTIPAHRRIPSGNLKIRLTGLTQDLAPGTTVPLTLHFANGTTREVDATTMLTY